MNVQVIERDGKPEWAVLPYEEYERLLEQAEALQDIRAYDQARQSIAQGEELVPSEVVYAILDGANPIRVWREHRGWAQAQLAQRAGMSASLLEQIETGQRQGTVAELGALAEALGLDLDDILEPARDD